MRQNGRVSLLKDQTRQSLEGISSTTRVAISRAKEAERWRISWAMVLLVTVKSLKPRCEGTN